MGTCRKSRAIGRAVLVSSGLFALARVAAAEPESVRIDYVAPAGCPDAAGFLRSLRERTSRFRQVVADEPVRRFLVRVTASAAAFAGRLEIRNPDGSTAFRSVDAAVCDEVASALALMTALAIDPDALTSGTKAAAKRPAEPTPESAGGPEGRPAPAAAAAVTASPPRALETPSEPWRWSAGAQGHLTFAVSPSLGGGADLFVDAEAPAASRLGPAARVGIFLNQSDVKLSGVVARFRWAAAAVEACPARLGVTRLTAHPCLAFRLGVLQGQGREISHPEATVSLWTDVGPLLRLRFSATARLLVEAQAALLLPLHRPTFEVSDVSAGTTTRVYAVPRVGGSVGLGAAYRFR
jgi:hypothetical protein